MCVGKYSTCILYIYKMSPTYGNVIYFNIKKKQKMMDILSLSLSISHVFAVIFWENCSNKSCISLALCICCLMMAWYCGYCMILWVDGSSPFSLGTFTHAGIYFTVSALNWLLSKASLCIKNNPSKNDLYNLQ